MHFITCCLYVAMVSTGDCDWFLTFRNVLSWFEVDPDRSTFHITFTGNWTLKITDWKKTISKNHPRRRTLLDWRSGQSDQCIYALSQNWRCRLIIPVRLPVSLWQRMWCVGLVGFGPWNHTSHFAVRALRYRDDRGKARRQTDPS